jgi:hypothetical protein
MAAISKSVDTIFVDVSDKPATAKVVREGYQVPAARFDTAKAEFFIDDLIKIPPSGQPRVVSQSIKPGVSVTPGTVVDLVLAPRGIIPFEIFENIHADLRAANLSRMDPALENATTRETLLKYEKAADVPAADRALLTTALSQGADIGIIEDDPTRNFETAFNAARSALAFR